MDPAEASTRIKDSVNKFELGDASSVSRLVSTLDEVSKFLAISVDLRKQLGQLNTSIWTYLRKLWKDLCRAQFSFWDEDDDGSTNETDAANLREDTLRKICLSLARLTRNIVAEVPENQMMAFESEPQIRQLLHYHTSWSSLKDQQSVMLARMLTQTLSNVITGNESLLQSLWEAYLKLPEDQMVLLRLLSCAESRIILPTFVLLTNILNGNYNRLKLLCRTPIGLRLIVCLLDDMVLFFEEDPETDGAQAFDNGYAIFTMIVEANLTSDVYSNLTMEGEIITPQQTIFLKLLDSYLQSNQPLQDPPTVGKHHITLRKLSPMFAQCFLSLSRYAQVAMSRTLGFSPPSSANSSDGSRSRMSSSTDSTTTSTLPKELDVMLPKVCEALVLIAQCMVTTALAVQTPGTQPEKESLRSPMLHPKLYFTEATLNQDGIVKNLIVTLQMLDRFLPRINFGKPVSPSPSYIGSNPPDASNESPMGFLYVKRDLVRLLGILAHGDRNVQDRVREYGGILVVLNMCVIDERNPYLREHAIFTLHNLLENNAKNQTVVDEIQRSAP